MFDYIIKCKDRLLAKFIRRLLTKGSSNTFTKNVEKDLLRCFRRAFRKVPLYRSVLIQNKVDPIIVKDIKSFIRNVPIIDKNTYFKDKTFTDFMIESGDQEIASFYSSSGHSKTYSFNAETRMGRKKSLFDVECMMNLYLDTFNEKTVLVNCLSMGVKVYTKYIPLVESSVRYDVAFELIEKLQNSFSQIIIVGEYLTIKGLLEYGEKKQMVWRKLNVHIIMGGEFIPESFRNYIQNNFIGEIYPNTQRHIVFNMGLSELSNTIFLETSFGKYLREEVKSNNLFKCDLMIPDEKVLPKFMHYFPQKCFIETIKVDKHEEMVISMLDNHRPIPLLRYHTGDRIKIFSYDEFCAILKKHGLENLTPNLKLPICLVWGRDTQKAYGEYCLSINEVKEYLYQINNLPEKITGYFNLKTIETGLEIIIQAKKNINIASTFSIDLTNLIQKTHKGIPVAITFQSFYDFHSCLDVDRERKYSYS